MKYRPPLGLAVRWIKHMWFRSCEVCLGRDLVVLAGHLAARGCWQLAWVAAVALHWATGGQWRSGGAQPGECSPIYGTEGQEN